MLLSGQGDFGVFVGISNYQGDLASYSTQDGFKALIGPVIGVHGGYEINKSFKLRTDLLYTRLAGDDALAEKEETREEDLRDQEDQGGSRPPMPLDEFHVQCNCAAR